MDFKQLGKGMNAVPSDGALAGQFGFFRKAQIERRSAMYSVEESAKRQAREGLERIALLTRYGKREGL